MFMTTLEIEANKKQGKVALEVELKEKEIDRLRDMEIYLEDFVE